MIKPFDHSRGYQGIKISTMAKKRNWTQIGLLLLFLVVFPIISYFYLKSGYDYRVDAMEELQEYGALPVPDGPTLFGDSLSDKALQKKVVLLHFIDLANPDQRDLMGKYMGEVHEQFDGVENVVFLAGFQSNDPDAVQAFLGKHKLEDPEQYFVFPQEELTGPYTFLEGGVTAKPYVMLSDTSGTIRNFYNLERGKELVRMVEHVTYLMPQEKRKAATIKPEQEL